MMLFYTGSKTFPIMYQLGKVRGACHEPSHRASIAPQGPANIRKWESHHAAARQAHRNALRVASGAGRSGSADQGGESIGRIRPAGLDLDHDHLPARPEGI